MRPIGRFSLEILGRGPTGGGPGERPNLQYAPPNDERQNRALHGLIRSLVANMVKGVSEGFTKELDIVGVGYRAAAQGPTTLEIQVGYSHPVTVHAPEGITFETLDMVARASTEAWAHVPCDQDGRGMQYYRVLPNAPTWNPPGYNPQGENSNTVMFNHLWIRDATHREGTIAITVATFDSLTGEIFDADIVSCHELCGFAAMPSAGSSTAG